MTSPAAYLSANLERCKSRRKAALVRTHTYASHVDDGAACRCAPFAQDDEILFQHHFDLFSHAKEDASDIDAMNAIKVVDSVQGRGCRYVANLNVRGQISAHRSVLQLTPAMFAA